MEAASTTKLLEAKVLCDKAEMLLDYACKELAEVVDRLEDAARLNLELKVHFRNN